MTTGLILIALPYLATWAWLRPLTSLIPAERIAITIAAGAAIPSVAFWLWRWAGLPLGWYAAADGTVWLAVLGVACWRVAPASLRFETNRHDWMGGTLLGVVVAALIAPAVAIVLKDGQLNPYGAWDAWAIWNLRARLLASPDVGWPHAFDPALAASHPDYPLLIPTAVARAWSLLGVETARAPWLLGVSFGVAACLTVAATLRSRSGPLVAALGLGLVAAPEFVRQSSQQLADVPLACFTVIAVALLGGSGDRVASPLRLGLSGAALGCAAWTKNEGLVVALGLPLLYAALLARRHSGRIAMDALVNVVIGLGPWLVLLALFKILVAPANDLVDGFMRPGVMRYWLDLDRVGFVLRYQATGLLRWGGWWTQAGPVVAVLALATLARHANRQRSEAVSAAGWLLVLQLAVFFVVYVMTPHSVAWHLQTSWSRLVAQGWPTLVWWACAPMATTSSQVLQVLRTAHRGA